MSDSAKKYDQILIARNIRLFSLLAAIIVVLSWILLSLDHNYEFSLQNWLDAHINYPSIIVFD